MKDSKTKAEESTRLTYTGLCHSCYHTYLETSVSDLDGNPANRATGHPSPMACYKGIFLFFFIFFLEGNHFFLKKMCP
jgi:hypothetical protein